MITIKVKKKTETLPNIKRHTKYRALPLNSLFDKCWRSLLTTWSGWSNEVRWNSRGDETSVVGKVLAIHPVMLRLEALSGSIPESESLNINWSGRVKKRERERAGESSGLKSDPKGGQSVVVRSIFSVCVVIHDPTRDLVRSLAFQFYSLAWR